jgi:non-homologous end joining protein Ku
MKAIWKGYLKCSLVTIPAISVGAHPHLGASEVNHDQFEKSLSARHGG